MHDFALHPRLAADTVEITRLPLCRVLLMNDANYPWLILVPQRPQLRELFELSAHEQTQFMRESSQVAHMMSHTFKADKINIAALGNVVPQLHIHHIARYTHDPAWPAPVWGRLPCAPYTEDQIKSQLEMLRQALACPAESGMTISLR
ncbi:MAG: HIT domain-containing protein [Halothiobacillaceae bacterium]|nr:HIT domain-containing protein [Halothiobacillaceae bacterium]